MNIFVLAQSEGGVLKLVNRSNASGLEARTILPLQQ